jgi:hypothetical protein
MDERKSEAKILLLACCYYEASGGSWYTEAIALDASAKGMSLLVIR